MRTRKPARPPTVVAVRNERLYLSPAGARSVRLRVAPADRERLDDWLAAGRIRIITATTKEPS